MSDMQDQRPPEAPASGSVPPQAEAERSVASGSAASNASDAALEREIAAALGDLSVMDLVDGTSPDIAPSPVHAGDHAMTRGTIVAIHDDDVFVELGGKSQGIIPLTQFKEKPELGSTMEFVVEAMLGDEGLVKLALKGAVEKATWQTLERGMTVEAKVTGTNTGGLELKLAGQRAFMPASQIDIGRVENFNEYLSKKLVCKIVELDRRGKRIIVSRRAVLEEQAEAAREELLKTVQVGDTKEGVVRSLQQYGAFVDIGGIDGLVHISDMAHGRVNKAEDVVKVGDKVQVKILRIEDEGKRISLGMKQVLPDPWTLVGVNYAAGQQVTGKIVRTANFGAFVEVEPGIEGLIPMSEMSWDRGHGGHAVKEGQAVTVKVLEVDPARQRMTLSLKQMGDDPWLGIEGEYAADSVVEGKVTRIADFGAFVELKPGVEGMIHISELSDKRTEKVEHVVKPGQDVKVKVLGVDPDQRRISLSIKALTAKEETRAPGSGSGGGGRGGDANRDDVRKYVIANTRKATSGESLGALLDKFGGPGGGLKGGIG